jgi:hypothetical protein
VHPVLFTLLIVLPGADGKDFDAEVLDKLNAYRKIAGLAAVKVDADLSKACQFHADYLIQNLAAVEKGKVNVHDEDAKLPSFSEAGRKAAKASVIAQGTGGMPIFGVDIWIDSYFHRTSLFDPSLTRIGIGVAKSGRSWAFVLDSKSGRDNSKASGTPVCYPVDKQKDVPLLFSHGWPEFPNPIPDGQEPSKTGLPITVAFYQAKMPSIKNVTATLKDGDGNAIEHWLYWPEKPAAKGYGGNTICLLPKAPLKANTKYSVQVQGQVNGSELKKTWCFETGEKK